MSYTFKYKRFKAWFWKKEEVIGHNWDKDLDIMTLFYPNGGQRTIIRWKDCEVRLGTDWVLALKKDMEMKAGHPIILDVDTSAKAS